MNPHRCENCKNYRLIRGMDECMVADHTPTTQERLFISQVGCASHSDQSLHISSSDLLLIAHDEWKRREERKHQHDNISWVNGWISGYLTSRKFVNDRIKLLKTK
jgi:hypothetical protein